MELSVAPAVLSAPVHVYGPALGALRLISAYGEEWDAPPVCVLFHGKHYDALAAA